MSDTGAKKPLLRYKRGWTVLASLVVLVVLAVIVMQIVAPGVLGTQERNTQPIHASDRPQPNRLTIVRDAYGPWTLARTTEATSTHHVLLLQSNGTVEIGSRTVRPTSKWHRSVVDEFRDAFTRGNVVRVRTTSGVLFTINVGQAFVLETRPEAVYIFQPNGNVLSNSTPSNEKR